jgi:hypothetical protein
MREKIVIEGACHCGNVKWTYSLPLESATACNCTLCSRYGALWAYGYLDHGVTVSGETSAYMRGRKINSYHFCSLCGGVAFYLANSADEHGRFRIAVNLRMINEPKQISHLPIDHFDGLDKFEDLPRDQRRVDDLWF